MASDEKIINLIGYKANMHVLKVNPPTISALFDEVSKLTCLSKDRIRLLYGGSELRISSLKGNPHTFNDYRIENYSSIALVMMLECDGGFSSLRLPDMKSAECFNTVGLTTGGPDYRIVKKGLNFNGICRNSSCIAYNKGVHMPKGMFESDGNSCFVNEEIENLYCPACDTAIPDKDCTGLGIHDCTADIECMTKEKQKSNYTIIANKDEFKEVQEMNDDDKVEYKYIKIRLSN